MMVNAYHNISSTHKKQQQKKQKIFFAKRRKKERRRKRFELHCHSMKIIISRQSHPDAPPRVAAP